MSVRIRPRRILVTACLGLMVIAVASVHSEGATTTEPFPRYHPSAVKGQTIELEVSAPPTAQRMTLKMQQREAMVDTYPPFRFTISTDDLRPAKYDWKSYAAGSGCCDGQSNGGTIQIYALPRIRAPRVSALVLAGTSHVVGLVVSPVGPNRVVRAWSFPKTARTGLQALPLSLRRKEGGKRIYRFAHGFTVDVGRRTEIAVEVSPARRVVRHGVELRGRLARLWLTRNRRSGAVRAHRSVAVACTTAAARKESFPGRLSCTTAFDRPEVIVYCAKLLPCEPGIQLFEERRPLLRDDRARER